MAKQRASLKGRGHEIQGLVKNTAAVEASPPLAADSPPSSQPSTLSASRAASGPEENALASNVEAWLALEADASDAPDVEVPALRSVPAMPPRESVAPAAPALASRDVTPPPTDDAIEIPGNEAPLDQIEVPLDDALPSVLVTPAMPPPVVTAPDSPPAMPLPVPEAAPAAPPVELAPQPQPVVASQSTEPTPAGMEVLFEEKQAKEKLEELDAKYDKSKMTVAEQGREIKALKEKIKALEKELNLESTMAEIKRILWAKIDQSITKQWKSIKTIHEQMDLIGQAQTEIQRAKIALGNRPEQANRMIDFLNRQEKE